NAVNTGVPRPKISIHRKLGPGRPATKGQKLEQQLDTLLTQAPRAYGSSEAGWTVEVLRDHLGQHDFQVSDTTVRRCVKSGCWVCNRFAATMPKHAPTAEKKKPGWQRLWPPYKRSSSSVVSKSSWSMSPTSPTSPLSNAAGFGKGSRSKSPAPPSAK